MLIASSYGTFSTCDADSMGIKLSKNGWNVAVAGARPPMRKMKWEHARQEVFTLRFESNVACVIDHKA